MSECCMVYFRSGTSDLDAAAGALTKYRLTVARQGDQLIVSRPDRPQFRLRLKTGESVRAEAVEIGEGTSHERAMQECDARFEIDIDDLDAALDEANTLMEVQGALQDASQGFLFLPWNGSLTEPWRG